MLQNFTSQITAATEWLQVNSGAVQAVFAGLLVLLTAFYVIFTNKHRQIGAGRYKNELMLIAESMRYHQYGNDAD